eukprot:1409910-Prymnesium_polylepis.1
MLVNDLVPFTSLSRHHAVTLSRHQGTEREPDKASLECHGHRPGVCVCVSYVCCVSVYVRAVQRSESVCACA